MLYFLEAELKLGEDIQTGRPSELDLNVRVSRLTRSDFYSSFKIGITNNPSRRQKAYIAHATRYTDMLVIYRTSSLTYVTEVEKELTRYLDGFSDNRVSGGGGNYSTPPYYVYIVREKKI